MSWKTSVCVILAAVLAGLAGVGCERGYSGLEPLPPNTDPVVFDDDFGAAVDYQAFSGSKLDAVSIDTAEKHSGTASLKVTVPAAGSTGGTYAGGAFTTNMARDLSGYNALTFWAKASMDAAFNEIGFGNDNTGNSKYTAVVKNTAITTSWQQFTIPIPEPDRLHVEEGLFFIAEGPEGNAPYTVWFDQIEYKTVTGITDPRPSMSSRFVDSFVGETVTVSGTKTIFDVNGTDMIVEHMPGYFTFFSSDEDVVATDAGTITVVGGGTAQITAALGDVPATGTVTVTATAPPDVPAPAPTEPANEVISLFSDEYNNVVVDTWSATWDQADVSDLVIGDDDIKVYTNLSYAGIEFATNTIDATEMNYFHIDLWIPKGREIRIKLVDFGADGIYQGEPDSESELVFNEQSDPAISFGDWVSLDIPLSRFSGLTARAHLAQLILSGDAFTNTVFVDNIYFHK